jgi:3-oxoacyl-[acyl-carrier-protein] synthase-3
MSETRNSLAGHILRRVRLVLEFLGQDGGAVADAGARFGDLLDSMGLVELVATLAEDFGVTPEAIEECVGGRFGTVGELAAALSASTLTLKAKSGGGSTPVSGDAEHQPTEPARPLIGPDLGSSSAWLAATAARLPDGVQLAAEINAALKRPAGWLERRAGIVQRRIWESQDPLDAAATAGQECLQVACLKADRVGALLVTSEAPPALAGVAAYLHHRLCLPSAAPALEVGGACTGFLAALWTAQTLLSRHEAVLVIAVEAPSRYLVVKAGPAGEAAALFGDGAAACLLCAHPVGGSSLPITEIVLGTDGSQGGLVQVNRLADGEVELHLDGERLAGQAIRIMEQSARTLVQAHGLDLDAIRAVVAHGGNGRMPALLARRLGVPPERVLSETPQTGNLGSASLSVAWAAHQAKLAGPVVWTAVGAGMSWGAALVGSVERKTYQTGSCG